MTSKKKEFPKNIRITKLYADGYKGLKDFEIDFSDSACWLLAGKNGSGKTRVGEILEIFHKIGTGESDLRELTKNLFYPINFILKIEGIIEEQEITYEINYRDSLNEYISYNDTDILKRDCDGISLRGKRIAQIKIPEDRLALPMIGAGEAFDEVLEFLKRISVLRPIPAQMTEQENIINLKDRPKSRFDYAQASPPLTLWYHCLAEENPGNLKSKGGKKIADQVGYQYSELQNITDKMKFIWPDLKEIERTVFSFGQVKLRFFFQSEEEFFLKEFSDGERIFFMTALLMAELETLGPRICYWDEPENYLAPSEIDSRISQLRAAFRKTGGQFIASSHNPLAMKNFDAEEIIYLKRDNHDESPKAILASDMGYAYGDDFREAYVHSRLNLPS